MGAIATAALGTVGAIAQPLAFATLAGNYPERVRSLDSETLLARPREALVWVRGAGGNEPFSHRARCSPLAQPTF